MDDIVVKSKDKATLIQDLDETFTNLRKINLKFNPEKCVFGVPSGKLLGFFVSRESKPIPTRSRPLSRLKHQSASRMYEDLPVAWLLSAGLSLDLLSAPCHFSKY